MATAVFFHAHSDDEVLFSSGTMARAAAEGHRVVLVTATRGERGLDRAGVVAPGGSLAERREGELREAAARLGVDRCHFLATATSRPNAMPWRRTPPSSPLDRGSCCCRHPLSSTHSERSG